MGTTCSVATLQSYKMQMIPLLQQGRGLRDDCVRHGRDAIERPEGRPSFHCLFRDVHAFAKGVSNTDRVTSLARSLASIVGCVDTEDEGDGDEEAQKMAVHRAGLLQKEAVWQGAAGAFVGRFRAEYGESYGDVVTGICDAVESMRLGLRVLAAACASAFSRKQGSDAEHPLVKVQGVLLSFPYTCCQGLTAVQAELGVGLGESLVVALGPEELDSIAGDAGQTGGASGAQHIMLLQVRFFFFVEDRVDVETRAHLHFKLDPA